MGWPIVGMIIETYGFVLLFRYLLNSMRQSAFMYLILINYFKYLFLFYSGFLPVAISFLRRVPILGTILNMPGLSRILNKIAGDTNRTTV